MFGSNDDDDRRRLPTIKNMLMLNTVPMKPIDRKYGQVRTYLKNVYKKDFCNRRANSLNINQMRNSDDSVSESESESELPPIDPGKNKNIDQDKSHINNSFLITEINTMTPTAIDKESKNSTKIISESNLVNTLPDHKLEAILMWLKDKRYALKAEFKEKLQEIIGGNHEDNIQLIDNVYEVIDLEDRGYIEQADLIDYLFEQGITKTGTSGHYFFQVKKELKLRSIQIIIYDQLGIIGIQEKHTHKYYLVRSNSYNVSGIVDIPKNVYVNLSLYLPDYQEIIIILSDKTFAIIDRKDCEIKKAFKIPETVIDVHYIECMKK